MMGAIGCLFYCGVPRNPLKIQPKFRLDRAGDLVKLHSAMLKNVTQAVILVVAVVVSDAVGAC